MVVAGAAGQIYLFTVVAAVRTVVVAGEVIPVAVPGVLIAMVQVAGEGLTMLESIRLILLELIQEMVKLLLHVYAPSACRFRHPMA